MVNRQIPAALALDPPPFEEEALVEVLDTNGAVAELDEQTLEMIDPGLAAVHRWSVTDEGSAEWAMRMVAAFDAQEAAIRAQYELWLEPIVQWRNEELDRIAPRRHFFASHLEWYGLRVRAQDPKRATISLPSGKIKTTAAQAPTVSIADEEALIKWAGDTLPAEEYEKIVETKERAKILELRKLVRVDEVPPPPEWEGNLPEDYEPEYRVVWASTGEVVVGLSAELAATTAKATPA